MAASNPSPSGFSYAQAAKGRASTTPSQTPSSKVTSGTATPATGTFSELAPNTSWADDVEAVSGEKSEKSEKSEKTEITEKTEKTEDSRKEPEEQVNVAPAKDIAVERTKAESIPQNTSSAVSSPDLAATSSTTNTDDSSSMPNGTSNGTSSSETTWETKSQNSEPAWIAERKERQTTEPAASPTKASSGHERSGKRGKKEPREPKEPALPQPPPKPVVLTEAPPPAVNFWAKRAEEAKSRPVAVPLTPRAVATTQASSNNKENVRARTEPRKKASSVADVSRETESHAESKKPATTQAKRTTDVRKDARQNSRPSTEDVRTEQNGTGPARPAQREAQSMPNLSAAAPPSVKDETSWPTPDTVQEQDRKVAEKDAEDAGDADSTAAGKARDKTKWTPLPVTPTIVWETEEMNRPRGSGGERGGRGSTTGRGRGGLRGAPSGVKGSERSTGRNGASPSEGENASGAPQVRSNATDGENTTPSEKPSITTETREGRQISNDGQPPYKNGDSHTAVGSTESASNKSNSKVDNAGQDVKPAPIHRQPAHIGQAEEARDNPETLREGFSKKHAKEARTFDPNFTGKEWTSTRGKGNRGGRGRGGSREFANGHQANGAFTNGHVDFAAGPFGVPQSPSAFQSPRGGHAFGYPTPTQGRGGWRGNGPRSQSIPMDHVYGRPYGSPPQLPPAPGYYHPGMYEYPNGMPMHPMPYNPMIDQQYLWDMVSNQLEYYFSLDNLLKDMFLRKNMDSQGFVFLDVIASFNRMKQLTTDKDLIKTVCLKADVIEIRVGDDGKDRLRRREGWEQFVLPMDQREEGAQNEGAQNLHRPELPKLQYWPGNPIPFNSPPPANGRRSHDSGFAMNGGVTQFAPMGPLLDAGYSSLPNGEENRGRTTKSPIRENGLSSDHQSLAEGTEIEPDQFPDEQISSLTVVVKVGTSRTPPHHTAASRTFSNGSIDTRSIYAELDKEKADGENVGPVANGEAIANGNSAQAVTSRQASPSVVQSPEKGKSASELILLWVKDKEFPQESLPQDSLPEPYMQLRVKALDQREQAATGTCPYDLNVLYQFWSHFLIRNFNNKMYNEFKYFANNDAQERHSANGLESLVQFYSKALASSSVIRDHIVKDYVKLVKSDPPMLQGLAHKQLRQAWRNGALNLKNRKKLTDVVDEPFKASLES
ncbi:unnamed protein product [Zymoseptoria tritici ST99CH_1A5]|uniref:HTH La-type RNA-binding domain-containing protein n=1 Tax=Zymoseptoria tritici ST99CH_1A5 TaxID=1276529 RepID=A0A1Y6L6W5_ZYMTR|nr:unnamed protein product [Zymoseptoria tritici ST99CH_1A5]